MLSGNFGVALFPKKTGTSSADAGLPDIRLDHFAFRVNNDAFKKAQDHFETLGIPFNIQDHHYFQSLYLRDPDGHNIELTTLVVDPSMIEKDRL